MLKKFSAILLSCVLTATLGFYGCSGGSDPVAADMSSHLTPDISRVSSSSRILWGVYEVTLDPISGTAEVIAPRSAEFTCNVTNFLQPPMSTHLIDIIIDEQLTDFDTGYVVCHVSLSHPFPWEKKFRGFDVRGIVMGGGSDGLDYDQHMIHAGENDLTLLNADGYTRWWNASEFITYGNLFGYIQGKLATPDFHPSATLNAYKYFADSIDKNDEVDPDPETRGTFGTVPGTNTRIYELQFPMDNGLPEYRFAYAVDASWYDPDPSGGPYFPVDSFPPEANMAEAFNVRVTDAGSTAWYVDENHNGGYLVLDIEVFDWQMPYNPDGIAGEVGTIWLDGDIVEQPVNLLDNAEILPGGEVSGIFRVIMDELNLTHEGEYDFWLVVESSMPDTYEPQIPQSTIPYSWPNGNLSAYFRSSVIVTDIQPQMVPVVSAITPDEGIINSSVPTTVFGSYFAEGAQVSLEQADAGQPFVVNATGEMTYSDGTKISCTLDLTGAPTGLYDVIVVNPSEMEGVLEDGFTATSIGSIIYVDSSNTTGPYYGTENYPFSTISSALNYTGAGSSIWVDDSDTPYVEQVTMKQGVDLLSINWDESDGDDEATIIPSVGYGTVVYGADNASIRGFEIIGMNGSWKATNGIVCNGVSPNIELCTIHDFYHEQAAGIWLVNGSHSYINYATIYDINNNTFNTATDFYGINIEYCPASGDDRVVIEHTIIHDVYASGYYNGMNCRPMGIYIDHSDGTRVANSIIYGISGGHNNEVSGIKVYSSDDVMLENLVIFDIYKTYNNGFAYGIRFDLSNGYDARNIIIDYVRRSLETARAYGVSQSGSTGTFEYSDVYICSDGLYDNVTPGTGCISANPFFLNLGSRDFHLSPISPCINSGDPGLPDHDGTDSDMGAYGGPGGTW